MRHSLFAAAIGVGLLTMAGLAAPASAAPRATAAPDHAVQAVTPVHDLRGWHPHRHVRPHVAPPRARWVPPRPVWHRHPPAPPRHDWRTDRRGYQRFGWR
jgi:hypothetical protein